VIRCNILHSGLCAESAYVLWTIAQNLVMRCRPPCRSKTGRYAKFCHYRPLQRLNYVLPATAGNSFPRYGALIGIWLCATCGREEFVLGYAMGHCAKLLTTVQKQMKMRSKLTFFFKRIARLETVNVWTLLQCAPHKMKPHVFLGINFSLYLQVWPWYGPILCPAPLASTWWGSSPS
jgi:hypothetical protein